MLIQLRKHPSFKRCCTETLKHELERELAHNFKQERQCTYNVTLRRVRVSLLPWKSNKNCTFVCARALACVRGCARVHGHASIQPLYPACNAYAPCCDVICGPLWLHHIFRYYLIKLRFSKQEVIEHKMCILIFSTIFVQNISHFRKNSARYCHKCENVFM